MVWWWAGPIREVNKNLLYHIAQFLVFFCILTPLVMRVCECRGDAFSKGVRHLCMSSGRYCADLVMDVSCYSSNATSFLVEISSPVLTAWVILDIYSLH